MGIGDHGATDHVVSESSTKLIFEAFGGYVSMNHEQQKSNRETQRVAIRVQVLSTMAERKPRLGTSASCSLGHGTYHMLVDTRCYLSSGELISTRMLHEQCRLALFRAEPQLPVDLQIFAETHISTDMEGHSGTLPRDLPLRVASPHEHVDLVCAALPERRAPRT
ncbi:hypothetical protein MRB53_040140 [Persea americana]|nr:hypothetical protein MRB53_040140 [Persea americana]